MMLDVDFAELKAGFIKNAPAGLFVGGLVLAELVLLLMARSATPGVTATAAAAMPEGISNTEALGRILYTKYVYFFQGAGLVLLVAMVGAIVLTLRRREGVKRQSIAAQVARGPLTAVEVVKVAPGQALFPETRSASAPEAGI
jgi:NADH-quinone oxidoreductase subunit J